MPAMMYQTNVLPQTPTQSNKQIQQTQVYFENYPIVQHTDVTLNETQTKQNDLQCSHKMRTMQS